MVIVDLILYHKIHTLNDPSDLPLPKEDGMIVWCSTPYFSYIAAAIAPIHAFLEFF